MEVGLFSSGDGSNNPSDPTQTDRFVTAMVKGTHNLWAIRGGNSESGALSTYWSGVRPSGGYNPMRKEGAIILGIGGENSNGAQGTFYEGVMTTGYPSDDTENAVQENIVAADYAVGQYNNGQELTVGSSISFHVTHPASPPATSPTTARPSIPRWSAHPRPPLSSKQRAGLWKRAWVTAIASHSSLSTPPEATFMNPTST